MNIVNLKPGQTVKNTVVHFGDSTLTKLLSSSLGGNTKTTMIVTASSRLEDFD